MKKPQNKTIKAWAIVYDDDNTIRVVRMNYPIYQRYICVFETKKDARNFYKKHGWSFSKIVRCTITYEV